MSKVRYIAVHLSNDQSGSPRVLADFCSTDAVQDEKLTIVTNTGDGFLGSHLGQMKRIFYFRTKYTVVNSVSYLLAQIQIFVRVVLLVLKAYLYNEKPVVVSNTTLCLSSMVASRIMGATTIAYVHELMTALPLHYKMARKVLDLTADEIIFVSQFLSNRYDIRDRRFLVIDNGLRSDFEPPKEVNYAAKFSSGHVLFVGSLRAYKGIHQFLEVAEKLPKIQFIALLSCTDAVLETFKDQHFVPKNVFLKASVTNIDQYYESAHALLNLSLAPDCVESFGMTVLEGMSFACPCVVPLAGGHLDYFDLRSGAIIDARDTDKIVMFLGELHENEGLWREYASHAAKVAETLSSEIYNKKVCEFLRNLDLR